MIILNRRKNFRNPNLKLINEQFEGPGSSGWTYTVSLSSRAWSDQYVTSPAPLVGSYSARIQATLTTPNQVNAQKTFSSSGNVYCRFLINHQGYTSGNTTLATIRDSAGNILATFGLFNNVSSAPRATATGGSIVNALTSPTIGTTYYCWFEYEKGTGTDAVCRAGYSTTSSRPTWPTTGIGSGFLAVSINGTVTANADRIMFGSNTSATNYDVIIDDIQVQSTPFD